VSTPRILIVAPDLGLNPDGTYRPGGIQYAGRLFRRALEGAANLAIRVVSQVDPPEISGIIGCGGSRLRLAHTVIRLMPQVDRVIYLHLHQAALSNLPGHPPFVVIANGEEVYDPPSPLRARALRRAESVIAISQFTARFVAPYREGRSPVRVVHLGIDPPASSKPLLMPEQGGEAALLCVGSMYQWQPERTKGHRALIQAWTAVKATSNLAEAALWIVGGGEDEPSLRALAAANPRITFFGRLSEAQLAPLWQKARGFVLPSRREGFGLVYLEAMRRGLPCIAGNTDAGAEIVIDGETGFTVSSDPTDIAQRCIRLLQYEALAEKMGAQGRQRFADHFTFDHFRARLGQALGLSL